MQTYAITKSFFVLVHSPQNEHEKCFVKSVIYAVRGAMPDLLKKSK